MSELILELFSEEIPALMQKGAEEAYTQIFTKNLQANEIAFDSIKVYSGSRRVTVHVTGLPKFVQAKEIEIKGPKVVAPAGAIQGFCNSNNVNVSDLIQKEINGHLFYFYLKCVPQTELKDLLLNILPIAIKEYTWPKSMYWGDYDISWVRPLKNIMCIFDNEILPVKFGHLTANNVSYGHRFMAPGEIVVTNFEDYKNKLRESYVIVDREERQEIIWTNLKKLASEYKVEIKSDARLLEEVTGLVEWPVVMSGDIDKKFLKVPSEALVASMRTHQKYFSAYDKAGNFAPYFLFVSNIESPEPELVVQGNEKVLSARLSDALYFYEQDLSKGLEAMGDKLKNIVFHEKLGTIADKVERVKKICRFLAPNDEDIQKTASLCKNDLTSEMVGEFPELQGIIGYYYALNMGIGERSAKGIRDHYKPLGPTDSIPQGTGATFAIADKIDSLIGLMLAGEAPTGSGDPYALRRMVLGIVRIIVEREWVLNLNELIAYCMSLFSFASNESLQHQILRFIEERAKFYFKDQYDISLINAVLDLEQEGDLVVTKLKLDSLQSLLSNNQGQELLSSYKRANNILKEKMLEGDIDSALFTQGAEKELFGSLKQVSENLNQHIKENNFVGALDVLATLQPYIGNFFDNVLVNDPDPKIANNRKLLLQEVKKLFEKIAKFDQL